jgi:hypothetical protein
MAAFPRCVALLAVGVGRRRRHIPSPLSFSRVAGSTALLSFGISFRVGWLSSHGGCLPVRWSALSPSDPPPVGPNSAGSRRRRDADVCAREGVDMPGILQESRNNGMWKKASPSPSRGLSSKVCAGQRHVEEGYHTNRGDAEVEVEPDVRIYNGLIDIFSNYGPTRAVCSTKCRHKG